MLGGSVPRVEKTRTGSMVNTCSGVSISRAIRYWIMRPAYHPRFHCPRRLALCIVWDIRNSVKLAPIRQTLIVTKVASKYVPVDCIRAQCTGELRCTRSPSRSAL